MIWIILLTSITVSLDSFACGVSLSLSGTKKTHTVIGIALTVLIMCLFSSIFTNFFSCYLTEKTAGLGGIILVLVGLFNLIKKENEINKVNAFKEIIATGIAVGLDGAFATLSLAIMGMNYIYIPFIIAFFHAVMIYLGTCFTKLKCKALNVIAPFILIALGIYKVLEVFL